MLVIHAMSIDFRLKKQNFALSLSVVFVVSLTLSLIQRAKRDHARSKVLLGCQELPSLFETKNLTGSVHFYKGAGDEQCVPTSEKWKLPTENRRILEHLLLTQKCPWEPNATAVAQYREDLGLCCNATFWLAVTKENTPLGSNVVLDGNKGKKLPVKAELFDLMPERSPFSGSQYRRCAVVGNGGILKNSHCGDEIDQADLIVRFNLPPMTFSEDVGTKTNLMTINPSILHFKYKDLQARRKPFADALLPYRDALFLIPTFSFAGQSDLGYRALYTMEDFGLMQQAFFLNPRYLSTLSDFWKKEGLKPPRLSSGFMLLSMALEFCEHITLYGFWPFPHDLADQPIPHHYYDNVLPRAGVHAMPSEFSRYLGMYAKGALRLRLGKCQ